MSTAFYLFENVPAQTNEWWKDKAFTKELYSRYAALEKGTDKGFTITELESSIDKLRIKKYLPHDTNSNR